MSAIMCHTCKSYVCSTVWKAKFAYCECGGLNFMDRKDIGIAPNDIVHCYCHNNIRFMNLRRHLKSKSHEKKLEINKRYVVAATHGSVE